MITFPAAAAALARAAALAAAAAFAASAPSLATAATASAATDPSAGPTTDALDRPAVLTRAPERQMLLSAAEAGTRLVAVGERGIIALSDDGGRTWRQVPTPVSVTLTGVRFADAEHGVVIGHGGTVLTTADGGQTWTRRLNGKAMAQLALQAAKTTNDPQAIKNAERLVADGPDKPLLDVLVLGPQRMVVVGAYGLVFASDDGGAHWTSWTERLDNPKGLHLYAIRQRGDAIVIAGEQGLALRSDDAGKTFHRLDVPYKGSWFTAELPGDADIVLAGLRGNVWRSADAGHSWTQVPSPMPVSITASTRRADGAVLLSNQAGFVLELKGDHLVPINPAPLPPLNSVLAPSHGPLLALSIQGAIPVGPQGSPK